jgi:ureidoglycolate dehydrogenase (NAD+)
MSNMSIPYQAVLSRTCELLESAGLRPEHARITAEAICSASLRGVDSHGIRLLPHYLSAIKAGRIDPGAVFVFSKTSQVSGILDANHGMGHAAMATAMDHAISLAEGSGMGFVSVKNSSHCGAMAFYGLRAAERDMIGLASTNATAKLKVFNATKPFFGINPVCITAPMEGEEPFCYDAAPTVMANSRIKMYAERGENLPPEVAADAKGFMTLDPALARMLIPLGGALAGYKGCGMAMVADIFCSLLSGMPNGRDVSVMYPSDGGNLSDRRYLGHFAGAIRIDLFEDVSVFKRRLKETADAVRGLPREEGATGAVMIPGDPEKKTKKDRLLSGIPIDEKLKPLYGDD